MAELLPRSDRHRGFHADHWLSKKPKLIAFPGPFTWTQHAVTSENPSLSPIVFVTIRQTHKAAMSCG